MTMPATAPKRLQIIDRVIAVLKTIVNGADYFYTPYDVAKRFCHWTEPVGYPYYMVFAGSGGKIENNTGVYEEDWYITIKGYVKDDLDTTTVMERCLRDIRKAINADMESGSAGSLAALNAVVLFEEPAMTDDGYLSAEGFGFFDQRVHVNTRALYEET